MQVAGVWISEPLSHAEAKVVNRITLGFCVPLGAVGDSLFLSTSLSPPL